MFSICWTLTAKSPKKCQCKSTSSIKLIFPKGRIKHGEAWHDRASLLIWYDGTSLLIWCDFSTDLTWQDFFSTDLTWQNFSADWTWQDFSTDLTWQDFFSTYLTWQDFSTDLMCRDFSTDPLQHNLVPRSSLSFYDLQPGHTVTPCYPSLLTGVLLNCMSQLEDQKTVP
jgi:hypothetical protein